MSHVDYETHHFLQLSGWTTVVIEGTLVDCEVLPFLKDSHTLFGGYVVSQEML